MRSEPLGAADFEKTALLRRDYPNRHLLVGRVYNLERAAGPVSVFDIAEGVGVGIHAHSAADRQRAAFLDRLYPRSYATRYRQLLGQATCGGEYRYLAGEHSGIVHRVEADDDFAGRVRLDGLARELRLRAAARRRCVHDYKRLGGDVREAECVRHRPSVFGDCAEIVCRLVEPQRRLRCGGKDADEQGCQCAKGYSMRSHDTTKLHFFIFFLQKFCRNKK